MELKICCRVLLSPQGESHTEVVPFISTQNTIPFLHRCPRANRLPRIPSSTPVHLDVGHVLQMLQRILKSPGCRKMPVLVQTVDDVVISATNFTSERCVSSQRASWLFRVAAPHTRARDAKHYSMTSVSRLAKQQHSILLCFAGCVQFSKFRTFRERTCTCSRCSSTCYRRALPSMRTSRPSFRSTTRFPCL